MIKEIKEIETHNCWDFNKCTEEVRQKCEAYRRNLGEECWLVMEDVGTGCHGYTKYNGCINCPWYKKQYPE